MINLIYFYICYVLLFSSVLGYGYVFNFFLKTNFENQIGIIAILGIVLLTLISYITSFITHHGYVFNSTLHLLGFIFFIKNINIPQNLKKSHIILILSILFIGVLISKTHDDFAFYHLQQTLNLSQNKIQIGLSNLDFSYAKHSSFFFLNSLFYLPKFNSYFFHFPNHFLFTSVILIFVSLISDRNNLKFLRYFSFLSLIYIILKFTRSSEYGNDIIGQILIILFIYYSIFFLYIKEKKLKSNLLIFLGILITFCFTLKTYFILYFFIYVFLIVKYGIYNFLDFIKKNIYFIFFVSLILINYFIHNIFSSGCLIYPLPFLCFDNLFWSMPKQEVVEYKIWYETWAKSIAGAGYILPDSKNLINNFLWIKHWINNYFFGRFTDNLFLILSLIFLFIILFYTNIKKNFFLNSNIIILYSLILSILVFWFLNHPTLRYGGYAPFFLIFVIPVSLFLDKYQFDEKKFLKKFKVLFCISLFFFFNKNVLRIIDEFERNDLYKYKNFPYFSIPDISYDKLILDEDIIVFNPLKGNCWSTPAPCPYTDGVKAKKIKSYIIFYREKKSIK